MKFACPHCQQPLEADDSFAGASVDCPACGKPLVIGAEQPTGTPPSAAPSEPQPESVPESVQELVPSQEPEAIPPLPPESPKMAPKFRVVSRPPSSADAQAQYAETPHSSGPKAASKFRVVSRTSTTRKPSAETGRTPDPDAGIEEKVKKSVTNLHQRFNDFAGLEKLEGFSLGALFSEVFGKHKEEDVEEFFTVGTAGATPPIEEVDTSWPRPWLFFRALASSVAMYLILSGGFQYFEGNTNLIPGMMVMGSLAVPFSALLFFYEVNVRRNISLYQVLRLFFFGGIMSLMISLVFFKWTGDIVTGSWEASTAGPIEESGKLLALVLVTRFSRYHYKLNGLLMGAAIGTGFAVFESMGYALNKMLEGILRLTEGEAVDPIKMMTDNIFNRGVLSPFGHIVWTAIAGAALWRVKGKEPFRMSMLFNGKFWHLFLVPVVLHILWNSPLLPNIPYHGRYLMLGFVAWFVVIALVQEGLKELRAEKLAALEAQAADAEGGGNEAHDAE